MEYSLLMCLLLSGQFIVSVKATTYSANDSLTPSNLIVCEGRTLNTAILLVLESANVLPFTLLANLWVQDGTAMEETHFNESIPAINLTRSADNTSASGTFDVSITSFDNNTDGLQFMLIPFIQSVTLESMSAVIVTLRNLVRPTLMFTVSVVSVTQVNISVSEAISEGPCPDNITVYTVSASEIGGNGHIQMSYPNIPQGEILSGLSPFTSYHLVVSGRTQSGVNIFSNTMMVTTLPFVSQADLEFERQGTSTDCNSGIVSWNENNATISTIVINYNRIGSVNSSQAMFTRSSSPSTVNLTVTSSGSGRAMYEFQVQLVSSDGRAGNVTSFTFECSGSAPLTKSIMTVVLCVAMAIMALTIF